MRTVHCVRDIATWKLRGHGLLSCKWYGLVLLREEEADLDTVIPRCVCIVVGKDTSRLGLESSNGFVNKGLVCYICVKDLGSVDRGDEFALQPDLNCQLSLGSLEEPKLSRRHSR